MDFLRAEWRKLLMANYIVSPETLRPYLPAGTELDIWDGKCYVSLVGFMFLNTKVMGLPIPFHRNFEEVNLRFYVKHLDGEDCKRGVVFIKEIVPRAAITFVANTLYKEHYETLRMSHRHEPSKDQLTVEYRWKKDGWHSIIANADPNPMPVGAGSEAEFITEHYWGYTAIGQGKTSEYEVAHPRWDAYRVNEYKVDIDFSKVYGPAFAFLDALEPASVLLAEGSDIAVKGKRVFEVALPEKKH